MVDIGGFNLLVLKCLGIFFWKKRYNMLIFVISENRFGINIFFVYFMNVMLKKLVDIMLIRLFIISGKEVVFVINLLVIMNGNIFFLLKFSVCIMVRIIGVRISVFLLLVKKVEIIVFKIEM